MSSVSIPLENKSLSSGKTKRSLTPYNLYYRFKRGRILQLQANSSGNVDKETILKIIAAVPGLEYLSDSELRQLHPKEVHVLSRDIIRKEMQDNLLPFQGKRRHRKTHGMMEFVEMSKAMCNHWKQVDQATENIFRELADEGKMLCHHRSLKADEGKEEALESKDSKVYKPACEIDQSSSITNRCAQPAGANVASLPVIEIEVETRTPSPVTIAQDLQPNAITPSYSSSPKQHAEFSNTSINFPFLQSLYEPSAAIGVSKETASGLEEMSEYEEAESSDDDDEFCAFIEKNIHLVVDDATLTDLINMDY